MFGRVKHIFSMHMNISLYRLMQFKYNINIWWKKQPFSTQSHAKRRWTLFEFNVNMMSQSKFIASTFQQKKKICRKKRFVCFSSHWKCNYLRRRRENFYASETITCTLVKILLLFNSRQPLLSCVCLFRDCDFLYVHVKTFHCKHFNSMILYMQKKRVLKQCLLYDFDI